MKIGKTEKNLAFIFKQPLPFLMLLFYWKHIVFVKVLNKKRKMKIVQIIIASKQACCGY